MTVAQFTGTISNLTTSVVNCYFLSLTSMTEELPESGVKSVEERYIDSEMRNKLRDALTTLPKKNREVLEAYYFQGETLEKIGGRLGLSKSWVSRLHAKSLDMLRTALEQAGVMGAASA